MSLPRDYNSTLRKQLDFYAAWFPVTMPYTIGDYGLINNGVFQKLGHLDDLRNGQDGFNVEVQTESGNSTPIDFFSEGASSIKTVVGANGPIPEFPGTDVEATLTYEFTKKNSFILKAANMTAQRMANIAQVAKELARLRRANQWSHQFKVVSSTFTGNDCLVLLSSKAGTKVEFSAKSSVLKQLDLGSIQVSPSISYSSDTILKVIGSTGPIGLKLFKLKYFQFLGDVQLLRDKPLNEKEYELENDWGNELTDDDLWS